MERIELNNLRDEVFKIAVDHGWHEEDMGNETCIVLIISELCEAMEADRKNKRAIRKNYDKLLKVYEEDFNSDAFELYIKDSLEDELADVIIRCLDLAGLRDLNMNWSWNKPAYSASKFPVFVYDATNILTANIDLESRMRCIIEFTLDQCNAMNIDIDWHIKQKVLFNKERPYKHGGKNY